MATDFISREAAIRSIADYDDWFIDEETGEWVIKMGKAEELLEAIPPADVRPVTKASWILPNADGTDRPMAEYSNCGWYVTSGGVRDFTFCPNCGADMRGLQE